MAAEERHDYVVVGAGTSGITLAYLLHKHGMDVVVLEAGEDRDHDPNIHDLKSFYGLESHYRNEYFWPENGRPNPRLPADGNHYSGGRLWGGSSSINEAWYWRGSQFIYDRWGGLFSHKAFCTDAFRKLETFHGVSQSPDARGDRGPFDITQGSAYPIGEKFIAALHSVLKDDYGLEVPVVDDMHTVNGPAMSVKAQHFVDLSDKKRVSTSVSLLKKKGLHAGHQIPGHRPDGPVRGEEGCRRSLSPPRRNENHSCEQEGHRLCRPQVGLPSHALGHRRRDPSPVRHPDDACQSRGRSPSHQPSPAAHEAEGAGCR